MRTVRGGIRFVRRHLENFIAPVGFSTRLAASMSALLVVSCVTLSWVIVRHDLQEIRRSLVDRGRTISEHLAHEAELSVLSGDAGELRHLGEAAVLNQRLLYYRFLDREGQALAASDGVPSAAPAVALGGRPAGPFPIDDSAWEFQAPVFTTTVPRQREEVEFAARPGQRAADSPTERRIGTVAIGVSTAPLESVRRRVFWTAVAVTSVVTLLGIACATVLAAAIGRPLRALAVAADDMARGAPVTVRVRSRDEVGALAASFNSMVDTLTRSRKELEAHNQSLEERVLARTERLETLNRELQEANHLRSEFLATVSHELRTPLNVILGYSEMLIEGAGGALSARQEDLLKAIHRYSKLQLDLITSILDFSRLASGKVSLQIERFDPAPALRDLAALFDGSREAGGAALVLKLEAGLPEMRTDRVKLLEVVRNLLDNAMKFTAAGTVWMRARCALERKSLVIEVEDTGPGIAATELPTIFDAFRQAGDSHARRTTGVGLGLSIVKGLVEVLCGTISVSSTMGVGSKFCVEIPLHLGLHGTSPEKMADPTPARCL